MTPTEQELLALARSKLDDLEFRVWFAKHYQHLGRRAGSLALGITEEVFRYRLATATRKMDAIQREETAA